MCYYHNKKSTPKLETATKDIVVYKVTNVRFLSKNGFHSIYQMFKYFFGKTYRTKIGRTNKLDNQTLHYGFHSYKTADYKGTDVITWKYIVANLTFKKVRCQYNLGLIFECVIPKGAKYYFNGTDYISNQIKPVAIIMPSDKYLKRCADAKEIIDKYYDIY